MWMTVAGAPCRILMIQSPAIPFILAGSNLSTPLHHQYFQFDRILLIIIWHHYFAIIIFVTNIQFPVVTQLGCPRNKQKNFFGLNRNKPKLNLFRLIFGLFRETKKYFFRFVSVFRIRFETTETNRFVSKQTEKTKTQKSSLSDYTGKIVKCY
jgi:hypothetical protein